MTNNCSLPEPGQAHTETSSCLTQRFWQDHTSLLLGFSAIIHPSTPRATNPCSCPF